MTTLELPAVPSASSPVLEVLPPVELTALLVSVRPVRDDEGRVRLSRVYTFQYSDTGHNRRNGSLTLRAGTVTGLLLASDAAPPADALS